MIKKMQAAIYFPWLICAHARMGRILIVLTLHGQVTAICRRLGHHRFTNDNFVLIRNICNTELWLSDHIDLNLQDLCKDVFIQENVLDL